MVPIYFTEIEKGPGIYRIYCKSTGKSYVGQSKEVRMRILDHFNRLRAGTDDSKTLQEEFDTYGEENFIPERLCYCTIEELDEKEKYYIELYKAIHKEYGYNKKTGGRKNYAYGDDYKSELAGENNPFYGKHHSEETKIILSEKHKGMKMSEETRKRMSESKKGKNLGDVNPSRRPEVREKIRQTILRLNAERKTKKEKEEAERRALEEETKRLKEEDDFPIMDFI